MANIKLGVTLYSFTDLYARGIYSLEDCMRAAAEMGARGYEIVGSQMVKGYPFVDDEFLGRITRAGREFGLTPVCYGANVDRGMLAHRDLTEGELLQRAIVDLKTAHALGCSVVRTQYLLSPETLVKLAPYAEDYGIRVGVEIHNPETPSSPAIQAYVDAIEASGSDYIGFVPDFGCFATKPNKPYWDQALENGATQAMLERAAELRYAGVSREDAREKLIAEGANEAALSAFENMYGFVTFYNEPDLEGLKRIMPHVFHFHGKFHYVSADLEEASIPYESILGAVAKSDFNGYIVSEFEGHGFYDTKEQVRRHLAMEYQILSKLGA